MIQQPQSRETAEFEEYVNRQFRQDRVSRHWRRTFRGLLAIIVIVSFAMFLREAISWYSSPDAVSVTEKDVVSE